MRTINLQQTEDDGALTATVYDRLVVFAFNDELQATFCLSKDALRKVVAEMDSEKGMTHAAETTETLVDAGVWDET